ncbi:MAG: hypothetical protein M3R55_10205 [Acidobacteriota bacterium]|nr:hypothetical protein [Acidobacteriota bacterium]
MALTTRDLYIAASAASQEVNLERTASRTAVGSAWFTVFDLAGNPGAGVLAGTSVAAGVVPTDATAGFPTINAFTGANIGYIETLDFGNTVAGRLRLYDLLWKGGAYPFNAAQALAAQPSFASRVTFGGVADYKGVQIWIECVTAFTGSQSIAVTYTNQDGVTGRTTGTVVTGIAPIVGRMLQLPLQAGDTGVQKIESVTSTISTVGTFNVLLMRRLWSGRCRTVNDGDVHGPDKTGLVQVFADSALYMIVCPDSTATGVPGLAIGLMNG